MGHQNVLTVRLLATNGRDDEDHPSAIWTRLRIVKKDARWTAALDRSILLQGNVSAILVVVGKVLTPEPSEMKVIEWDNVIQ